MKIVDSQRGIALLTVLWVLTVLMVIVFSFSYMARTETLSTLAFKEGMEKRFLAEAGVERGILELFYQKRMQNSAIKDLVEGGEVWKTDGTPFSGQLGDGTYTVRIFDESGKININSLPDNLLEQLLRNLVGNLGFEGTALDTIVDSILDWRDKDDLHRLHGAESDYYQSLPNPYKAKNGNFDTLEELLLVKGVTRELLYGVGKKKGLFDFLTVHGIIYKINVNAAPKEVLMAIPGMSAEVADALIAFRQTQEIQQKDLAPLLGTGQPQILLFADTSSSNIFSIESSGYREKPQSGYAIRTTVTLDYSQNKYTISYYKIPVHLKQDEISSQ
jgi:general secretion pathway protein K